MSVTLEIESVDQSKIIYYYIGMINCTSDDFMSIWPISRRVCIALSRGALVVYYDRRHLYLYQ